MKKELKILFVFLFIILILGICKKVEANSINSISMDIYINNNGDAVVTEEWKCNATKGTEVYHPYYNLGKSTIKDLKVSENGVQYKTLNNWDTSGSLSSKANKCGINHISNGVELCWGISSYGSHIYKAQYTITKFVSELTDAQMIYWTLIPYDFSNRIGSVNIKIHADFPIEDTIDVWGYGNYGGLCYVENGNIYMESNGDLDTSEYMTILVKFPLNTFELSNVLDYDFEHYFNMAQEGAVTYHEADNEWILPIFTMMFYIIGPILVIIGITSSSGKQYGFKYGNTGKKIPRKPDYYRNIPCNEDIFKTYYIAYQYGIIKSKTDILGALILKWLKTGIIRIENINEKIFKKDEMNIILNTEEQKSFDNSNEKEMFEMMIEASNDGILEKKEFEKWSKKHYSRILTWFDDILREERTKLVNENKIIDNNTTGSSSRNKRYMATQELKDEAIQIAGLKRYLLEYTLIRDRESIEVHLFEDYLIFAQILGIAKKVQKQFKDLYPDIIEQTNYSSYDNILFINLYSSRVISSANSAKAAAESYSSGGGGFSSGGGGGGSFGGGGGGRRLPLKTREKILKNSCKVRKNVLLYISD